MVLNFFVLFGWVIFLYCYVLFNALVGSRQSQEPAFNFGWLDFIVVCLCVMELGGFCCVFYELGLLDLWRLC